MAFINIENAAISIQLNPNEEVTVPSGEVWHVVVVASNGANTSQTVNVNGKNLLRVISQLSSANNAGVPNDSVKTFFAGGDVIRAAGANLNVHISGFVVQEGGS